ncbi:putative integral membrane protein [Methyloglobulus morosus KoM1]|uniref:Putative integral membrane protein n=2 Tax=Methyloglobulus TaxID=1410680 RepID=V5BYB9_9GAMM|nr:putative integral membrane protein [Methyloglobulus morosus KoM1]
MLPVIFLVFAATAIPIEFRPLGGANFSFAFKDFSVVSDVIANIIGYIPIGIIFGEFGLLRACFFATLISTFSETSQLIIMHRYPGVSDVISNVSGATLGALVSLRWTIRSPAIRISRWNAIFAALLTVALILYVWTLSSDPISSRGTSSPGTLEALWKLDENSGRTVLDFSGHEMTGKFSKEPIRLNGMMGNAAVFDGTNYIDFGHSTVLRLAGNMTITAWIKSSSYPVDDAAIVSQLQNDRGYQLDTTIDRGSRTIGFKLTDACGNLMSRYGATSLALNTWYHVVGVYNAAAQTLDVYLNGELDNGFLLGSVSGVQRSSRGLVYVGRRSDSKQFNFSGSIDDVRIYSFALTKSQIAAVMHAGVIQVPTVNHASNSFHCGSLSDNEDKELPGIAATLGVLVALACIGIWPSYQWPILLGISFAAGLLLLTVTAPNLPAFNTWMLPLVSLAGGASVAASVRRPGKHDLYS